MRSQEITKDLAAFKAVSAGESALGSTTGTGGCDAAATACAARAAACAGDLCDGPEGWEAMGLPRPLAAEQPWQRLWNDQLVLNPQLQAQTGPTAFAAGRPWVAGPGGGAAARRGAITEHEDCEWRNCGGLRTACVGECG